MEADLTWGNCFTSRFFSRERETDRERGQDPQWHEVFSILAKIMHPEVFMLENVFSSEWQRCLLCLGNASTIGSNVLGSSTKEPKSFWHNSTDSSGVWRCSSREFAPLILLDFFSVHDFFNIPLLSCPANSNSAFELQFSAWSGYVRSLQSSHRDQMETSGV